MANRKVDSNPYGYETTREAERIANDALDNVGVPTDTIGRVSGVKIIGNESNAGSGDSSKSDKTEGRDSSE